MSAKRFALVSGFVDQEEMLNPSLTVRETLLFSANLRLPESYTRMEKHAIVDRTLEELGISNIAHSRIGGNGVRGISGGEKRRVSIGIELVTSPSILLLDEPTSGLDSYNAQILVKVFYAAVV
jgi:ABC-type multidrug transport system ATPase subunit